MHGLALAGAQIAAAQIFATVHVPVWGLLWSKMSCFKETAVSPFLLAPGMLGKLRDTESGGGVLAGRTQPPVAPMHTPRVCTTLLFFAVGSFDTGSS